VCGKGRRAARKVWSLGEKLCRNDFRRRWILFRYLVQSVRAYGVEIWRWEKKEELEKIMMVIRFRILYTWIYYNKRAGNGQIESRLGNKS